MSTQAQMYTKVATTQKPAFTTAQPGLLQRKCACGGSPGVDGECAECRKNQLSLQRRATNPAAPATVPPIVHDVLRSPGQPLDAATRAFMEPRFGHDFSNVRVHTDTTAAESARAVNALAYTVGPNVVFDTGQYTPEASEGKRLLAHELAHVVQQGPQPYEADQLIIGLADGIYEHEANYVADQMTTSPAGRLSPITHSTAPSNIVHRQPAQSPCPTSVTFSFGNSLVHVPSCGTQPLRAQSDAAGVAWSLLPNPTAVDPGTTIAANGVITLGSGQAAGQIQAVATGASGCSVGSSFNLSAHPTGIASTQIVGSLTSAATDYGAVFDHTFVSSDGNVASLENVAVGERFIGVPNPTGATHRIVAPANPFGGAFTLNTATLTPNTSNNWFLTATGGLNGNQDNISIGKANVNVGRFVQSTSNPTPPSGLPATFTLIQGLHWFCPQAAPANRWQMPAFVRVAHSRTLRNTNGNVEFVTTVNGIENAEDYTGPVAVFNANASPINTPKSAPAPAAPGTVAISVDTLPATLPSGQALLFSLVGNARGCTIAPDPTNDHAAVLTIGTTSGAVVVGVADSTATNRTRATVTIT